MSKVSPKDILKRKGKSKITMLTCYDYSFAGILDESGVDIILVGDSLANVILGLKETRRVSIKEMLNHTSAVARGVKRALVVADMPYLSYQKDPKKSLYYARKFIAAGASAVKIEWFAKCPQVVKKLIQAKIPVMGHVGLTPQTAHLLGGYKVQGKDHKSAALLAEQAKKLQRLGVFSLVLECVPSQVSRRITKSLKVPTLGIGAGKYCDGQVLVVYDLLGLYTQKKPKFVRVYRDLSSDIKAAISRFKQDVKNGRFPSPKESF
jgi:3-methyl-2-oxobutanoate hydroxymethyltransferase